MYFKQIFEEKLAQYSYLIGCQQTGEAIIIDPMRDIDRYVSLAEREDLRITAAADTHIHADYLSGLREFAEKGITVYASGEGGENWQYEWLKGSAYRYQLLKNGDRFSLGNIRFEVQHTPGHTPEHISFMVTDGAAAASPMGMLTGDFIFVGDVGRPDLLESAAGQKGVMEASARTLYRSVETFKGMPEYLQIWPGHGAGSACGKALGAVPESTVGYELRFNDSIKASDSEQHFVRYILEGQPEPPLYFARMKRDNRSGPALLGELPRPPKLQAREIISAAGQEGNVMLDSRERTRFMKAHVKGALLAPFDRQFNTVAGSYIREDEQIYLVIEEENLEQAVRDLVRIGLDNLAGYVPPEELEAYLKEQNMATAIETIDLKQTAGRLPENAYGVLDVRRASEFSEAHIEGAVNIAHTRLLDRKNELDRDKTWLVYCRSGTRSAVASALLHRHGFSVVYVNDYFENWPEKVSV